MVRIRLVLLVTIAALVAPWIAPCLQTGMTGHAAMPCCRVAKDAGPTARPCCAPADGQPSTPPAFAASLIQAAPPIAKAVVSAAVVTSPTTHLSAYTLIPVRSPVRSSVLLI
jgi:hypothetical protein